MERAYSLALLVKIIILTASSTPEVIGIMFHLNLQTLGALWQNFHLPTAV